MATTLIGEIPSHADNVYFDQEFMSMIEYHLPMLRVDQSTEEHPVDTNKRIVYEGDLYGYLKYMNVPANLHWITLRLNKMHSNHEFREQEVLLIPHPTKIDNLLAKYRTKNRKL